MAQAYAFIGPDMETPFMDSRNEKKYISKAIINRLPRYYRYLGELKAKGVERISSSELSSIMNVTASQIRQDLNNFGGFGQQGYGYNVDYLHDEIGKILGIDRPHKIVTVGAGNLGSALSGYQNFPRYGFNIMAMFDNDEAKIGSIIHGIPVLPVSGIVDYINENDIEIVILAIPKDAARELLHELEKTNIRGVWNFAHTDFEMPGGVVVENVHLSESLMRLSYEIANPGEPVS